MSTGITGRWRELRVPCTGYSVVSQVIEVHPPTRRLRLPPNNDNRRWRGNEPFDNILAMDITDDQLKKLEQKARDLKSELSLERPVFVEFAGTPKSGKSTSIEIVNHFFRRVDFKVLAPAEGASKRTPYFLKQDLVAFNAWSASYALNQILEGRYGSDAYELVILDRGLFDACTWFEFLRIRGRVSDQECSAIQEFLLLERWREIVDIVFLFEADPDTALKRENADKLIAEFGTTMNPTFLEQLNRAYQTTREKYADQFNRFHVINTGASMNSTPKSTALEIANHIIAQFQLQAEGP